MNKVVLNAAIICCFLLTACQKEITGDIIAPGTNPNNPNNPQVTGRLVQIKQGVDPQSDTTYQLYYNSLNKISYIVDSVYADTIKAVYNTAGKLIAVDQPMGYQFSYDAAGLLKTIELVGFSRSEFEYVNGVIAKHSEYVLMAGPPQLWEYHEYTLTNGNITEIKTYNAAGALQQTMTLTYGPGPNIFKELSLFNAYNSLGLIDVANMHTYFNANILTGISVNSVSASFNYTFANNQLAKLVAILPVAFYSSGHVFTWNFKYN